MNKVQPWVLEAALSQQASMLLERATPGWPCPRRLTHTNKGKPYLDWDFPFWPGPGGLRDLS